MNKNNNEIRYQERYNPLDDYGKFSKEDIQRALIELERIQREEKEQKQRLIAVGVVFGVIILLIIIGIVFKI